ncbi:MAG: hypothetical protein QNJ64_08190 [Crocosphaera sp.]|nr:hypothetical protein [Crocosphaera sp.]
MTTFLTKHQIIAATASLGLSLLGANAAQAASFNFSYTFDPSSNGNNLPVFVNGMVDGDLVGNTLTNVSNIMAEVTVDTGASIVSLATFNDAQFLTRMFTLDGVGVDITTDNTIEPFLELIDGSDAKYSEPGFVPTETYNPDNWSLTAKSVPENDISGLSWLALAAISGISLKREKIKSFFK